MSALASKLFGLTVTVFLLGGCVSPSMHDRDAYVYAYVLVPGSHSGIVVSDETPLDSDADYATATFTVSPDFSYGGKVCRRGSGNICFEFPELTTFSIPCDFQNTDGSWNFEGAEFRVVHPYSLKYLGNGEDYIIVESAIRDDVSHPDTERKWRFYYSKAQGLFYFEFIEDEFLRGVVNGQSVRTYGAASIIHAYLAVEVAPMAPFGRWEEFCAG